MVSFKFRIIFVLILTFALGGCSTTKNNSEKVSDTETQYEEERRDYRRQAREERRKNRTEQLKTEISQSLEELLRDEILPEIRGLVPYSQNILDSQSRVRAQATDKIILGRVERVRFLATDMNVRARIDTGAQTSSLHVESVGTKEIEGEKYVQFETIDDDDERHVFLKRVVRESVVRSTSGEATERYVVLMNIQVGEQVYSAQVNLSDRSKLEHRFLVGRNLLMGNFVVDVSQSRLLGE